jgi:predicted phosphate transport protein (TIGR00153 family)
MAFFRKKIDFFKILSEQAAKTLEGMQALEEYMKKPAEALVKDVFDLEREADSIRRTLIDELNKTFATPIDREDLFELSREIDDIIDYAKSTVDEMQLLEIKTSEHLVKMVGLLVKATLEIKDAVGRLKENPSIASEHALRAKKLENEIELVYRDAIKELFNGDDVICMLKTREIYRHLSNAGDRVDQVANVISGIVVKMT